MYQRPFTPADDNDFDGMPLRQTAFQHPMNIRHLESLFQPTSINSAAMLEGALSQPDGVSVFPQ